MESDDYGKLFQAMVSHDVQRLAEVSYEILGMPVLISDSTLMALGKFPIAPSGDEQWDADEPGKRTKPEYVYRFANEGFFSAHEGPSKVVLANRGFYERAPRLSAYIQTDGSVVGLITVLAAEKTVEPWHFEMVEAIADAAALMMSSLKSAQYDFMNSGSMMLRNLLYDRDLGEEDQIRATNALRMQVGFPVRVYAAKVVNDRNSSLISYFRRLLVNALEGSAETVVGDIVYVLRKVQDEEEFEEGSEWFSRIRRDFESKGVICGCSVVIEDGERVAAMLRCGRWQAEKALGYAESLHETGLFAFENCMKEVAVRALRKNSPFEAFVHPCMRRLINYDAEHGTEYYKTLRLYELSNRSNKETAKALGIHLNTLAYRLDKIFALLDKNMTHEDLMFYFTLIGDQ